MFLRKKLSKNIAKIYENPETNERYALLALNGEMKDKILANLKNNYMVQGDHISNGGEVSKSCIPGLLACGGASLGISAAASGSLFMATANSATLMAIGNGVGSAVMGAGGIVAHAPFIPVSGAIMPVASPLLAFQLLSTITMMQQFKPINERLIKIEKAINRVIQRNEAEYIGELFSAISRLDILEDELSVTNKFTQEMIIRLSLIENNINPILERYKYLYEAQAFDTGLTSDDLAYNRTDAYMSIVLSIVDLRIDMLRLRLTVQENPGYLSHLSTKIIEKVEQYKQSWNDIENSPIKVEQISNSLKETISDMNWWQRNCPSWLLGKREQKNEIKQQMGKLSELNSYQNTNDLLSAAREAKETGDALVAQKLEPVSLIYWEDETGKHSYYTNDIIIK